MTYSDPSAIPPHATPLPGRQRFRRSRRTVLILGSCLTLVAGTGLLLYLWPDPAHPQPLVIDVADTVLDGQDLSRPVVIAADRVTLRRVTVRTGGSAAIRIRPGVTGALIEDSTIRCVSHSTDGIVPGNYTARRVHTYGCREPFLRSTDAPAMIIDSTRDGKPYPGDQSGLGLAPSPPTRAPDGGSSAGSLTTPPTPIDYWPGPTTTGVPAGTVLRDSGSLDLRTAGQVVSGLNVKGCVIVRANNVVIRNSKITCTSTTFSIRVYEPAINLLVENVEINGSGKNSTTVCCGEYTLRRVNIYNSIDGPRLGNRTNILDSWIHDLTRVTGSHNDTLQVTGASNMVVRHNRLEPYKLSTNDPMNACIMVGSTTAPSVSNLLFEDNYCNGGNYSIGVRTDLTATNCVFRKNKYGRNYRYGIIARPNQAGIVWDKPTNVWFDNGLPVL